MNIPEVTKTQHPTSISSSNFQKPNQTHLLEADQNKSRAGQRRLRTETQNSPLALQNALKCNQEFLSTTTSGTTETLSFDFDNWFFQTSFGRECKEVLEAVQGASIPLDRELVERFVHLCETGGYYDPSDRDEDESGRMYGARSEKLVEMGMLYHWLGDLDKSASFISRAWQEGNPLAYLYGKCHPELWTNDSEPSLFIFDNENEYYDWPHIPEFLSLFNQGKWAEALQLGSSDDVGQWEGPILKLLLLKEMALSNEGSEQWPLLLDEFDAESSSLKISFENLDFLMNDALKKLVILSKI